jgi:hypothetical protein
LLGTVQLVGVDAREKRVQHDFVHFASIKKRKHNIFEKCR